MYKIEPGVEITEEMFTKAVGIAPVDDDLERSNCKEAGTTGHSSCGWNYTSNKPCFMVPNPKVKGVNEQVVEEVLCTLTLGKNDTFEFNKKYQLDFDCEYIDLFIDFTSYTSYDVTIFVDEWVSGRYILTTKEQFPPDFSAENKVRLTGIIPSKGILEVFWGGDAWSAYNNLSVQLTSLSKEKM